MSEYRCHTTTARIGEEFEIPENAVDISIQTINTNDNGSWDGVGHFVRSADETYKFEQGPQVRITWAEPVENSVD